MIQAIKCFLGYHKEKRKDKKTRGILFNLPAVTSTYTCSRCGNIRSYTTETIYCLDKGAKKKKK